MERGSAILTRAFVDTSALLALANPRDQFHASAQTTVENVLRHGTRLIGTTMILGELHGLLLHRAGIQPARSVVGALLADPLYEWREVGPALTEEAVARWLDRFRDQRFTLVDAVSFEVMRREKVTTAFTYDRDFETAGFTALT